MSTSDVPKTNPDHGFSLNPLTIIDQVQQDLTRPTVRSVMSDFLGKVTQPVKYMTQDSLFFANVCNPARREEESEENYTERCTVCKEAVLLKRDMDLYNNTTYDALKVGGAVGLFLGWRYNRMVNRGFDAKTISSVNKGLPLNPLAAATFLISGGVTYFLWSRYTVSSIMQDEDDSYIGKLGRNFLRVNRPEKADLWQNYKNDDVTLRLSQYKSLDALKTVLFAGLPQQSNQPKSS